MKTTDPYAFSSPASRGLPLEASSFESHFSRQSLFEIDEERFCHWLRAAIPARLADSAEVPLDTLAGGEAAQGGVGYWRADSPHRVATRCEGEDASLSVGEEANGCTEFGSFAVDRSLFGSCAPLLVHGPTKESEPTRNRELHLQESAEDWYDVEDATRDHAARILQLLEHHQSQWLTVPQRVLPLPLPKLPG